MHLSQQPATLWDSASDLIFYWQDEFDHEPMASEVVDRALACRAIELWQRPLSRFGWKLTPMNLGGPADHWYTDIFTWNRPAFGEPVDSLIRDIRNFGGAPLIQDDQPLGCRLCDAWPQWGRVDDQARGWEVE